MQYDCKRTLLCYCVSCELDYLVAHQMKINSCSHEGLRHSANESRQICCSERHGQTVSALYARVRASTYFCCTPDVRLACKRPAG